MYLHVCACVCFCKNIDKRIGRVHSPLTQEEDEKQAGAEEGVCVRERGGQLFIFSGMYCSILPLLAYSKKINT